MATVKFPQEMDASPTIAGDDKLMIAKATTGEAMQATFDSAKQYLNITGIEVKAVTGGATEETAVVLSPGPDGQVRKMSGVTGWFKNAGGTPWLAPTTNDNSNWWDGTTWSLGSSVPLPMQDVSGLATKQQLNYLVNKKTGKNLFDINSPNIIYGKYINSGGEIIVNSQYNISDWMPIDDTKEYYANFSVNANLYWETIDENGNRTALGNTRLLTPISGSKFYRTSYYPLTTSQFEEGTEFTGFEPYTELNNSVGESDLKALSVPTEAIKNDSVTGDKLVPEYRNAVVKEYTKIDSTETLYLDREAKSSVIFPDSNGRAWACVYKNTGSKVINGGKVKPTKLLTKVEFHILQMPDVINEENPGSMAAPVILKTFDITKVWNDNIGSVTEFFYDDFTLLENKNYAFGFVAPQGQNIGYYWADQVTGTSIVRPRITTGATGWSYATNSDQGLYVVIGKYNLTSKYVINESYLDIPVIPDIIENDIVLPAKMYMLTGGVQHDIFVEPFIKRYRPNDEDVRFSGTTSWRRRFQRVASVDNAVNGRTIVADLVDRSFFKVKKTATSTIVASSPGVGSTNLSVLLLGDSYTQGEFFKDALFTKGYVPSLSTVGIRQSNTIPNQFIEGRGGWTLSMYFQVSTGQLTSYNPFYQPVGAFKYWGDVRFWKLVKDIQANPSGGWTSAQTYPTEGFSDAALKFDTDGYPLVPVNGDIINTASGMQLYDGSTWISTTESSYTWDFDFSKYLNMWSLSSPDVLSVLLGLNDFRNASDPENIDFTTWNSRLEKVISSFRASNPSGKVAVNTACSTCGTLENTSGDYTIKQNACMWSHRKNVIDQFDGRESEGIYIVDIGVSVDNEHGYSPVATNDTRRLPFMQYPSTYRIDVQDGNPHPYRNYPDMGIQLAAFLQHIRSDI